jgi:hypothetical protein
LPLRFGHDYAAVYDSTMARFWFLNERARQLICDRLQRVPQGRILTDGELEELGTLFPDRQQASLGFAAQSLPLAYSPFPNLPKIDFVVGAEARRPNPKKVLSLLTSAATIQSRN